MAIGEKGIDDRVLVYTALDTDNLLGSFSSLTKRIALGTLRNIVLPQEMVLFDQVNFPYYYFNGISGNILIKDQSKIVLTNEPFTFVKVFKALSAGEGENGQFFDKGFSLRYDNLSAEILFSAPFTTQNGVWKATILINLNSILSLSYKHEIGQNPVGYYNGQEIVWTQITTPVGTPVTDSGSDLYLNNSSGGGNCFDGNDYRTLFFNKLFTTQEHSAFTSNPNKLIDYSESGASNEDITALPLIIGKQYKTFYFQPGDDFSNVADIGSAANITGAVWIAVGDTPATWTTSILHRIGCLMSLDEFSPVQARDRQTGITGKINDGILANRIQHKTYEDVYYSIYSGQTIDMPGNLRSVDGVYNVVVTQTSPVPYVQVGTVPIGSDIYGQVNLSAVDGLRSVEQQNQLNTKIQNDPKTWYIYDSGFPWTTLDVDLYIQYELFENLR